MVEGKIIYHGDAQKVKDYFVSSFNLRCPTFMNPPDFFMSKIHHESEENRNRYPLYMQTYDEKLSGEVSLAIQNREKS